MARQPDKGNGCNIMWIATPRRNPRNSQLKHAALRTGEGRGYPHSTHYVDNDQTPPMECNISASRKSRRNFLREHGLLSCRTAFSHSTALRCLACGLPYVFSTPHSGRRLRVRWYGEAKRNASLYPHAGPETGKAGGRTTHPRTSEPSSHHNTRPTNSWKA